MLTTKQQKQQKGKKGKREKTTCIYFKQKILSNVLRINVIYHK